MMYRRELLKVAASGVAVAPALRLLPSVNAIEPIERGEPAVLKLSLAAYSFRQALTGPEASMDLLGFVDYCHSQGLSGAELTSYYFPEQFDAQYLRDLARHCHVQGVTVSGGAIRNDYCTPDKKQLAADVEHTKRWIEHYSVLGAPAIRVFAGKAANGESIDTAISRCIDTLGPVCDYAYEHGVMLALENHGGVTAEADDLLKIVRGVESPALGINFDSGNFRTADPYGDLAKIAPYAVNAQVKVEMYPDGQKQAADLKRIVEILREARYSGWVALEYEAAEPAEEAVPRWLAELRKLLDA